MSIKLFEIDSVPAGDWKRRCKRGVEPSSADDDVHGVLVAFAIDHALLGDTGNPGPNHLDVISGKAGHVFVAGREPPTSQSKVGSQIVRNLVIANLCFHTSCHCFSNGKLDFTIFVLLCAH